MSHKFRILLVNTKVPRETKILVTRVATLRENYPTIFDHILNALNEIAENALQYFVNISKIKESTPDGKKKFKQYFRKLGVSFCRNEVFWNENIWFYFRLLRPFSKVNLVRCIIRFLHTPLNKHNYYCYYILW